MATVEEIRARWQAATPGPWARCSANDGDCACGSVWDAEGRAAVAAVQEHNELGEGWTHEQYRANWDAVTAAPTDVVTLLAALDAAQAALREIAAHQPYPDAIWIPLTAEEQQTLHAAMLATTVRHPLDRLYAGWGRQVLAQTAALATVALNGEGAGA